MSWIFDFGTVKAALLGLLIGWLAYRFLRSRKYNLPPGPSSFPLVGHLFHFVRKSKSSYQILMEMSKKHGPILRIHVGFMEMIILNDMDTALEMLVTKSVDFAGRPRNYALNKLSEDGSDIVMAQFGPRWQLHRKMAAKALRNYISGPKLEERVHRSFKTISKIMATNVGPVDPINHISLLVANIICGMCFSKSYEMDDAEFKNIFTSFERFTELLGKGLPCVFLPILRFLPHERTRLVFEINDNLLAIIQENIDEHRRTLDSDNLRDLTDFIIQAKVEADEEDESGLASQLTDVHVRQTIFNMFGAGIDTSRNTINWVLFFMAYNPDVQKKVQDEIDAIVGRERLPGIEDKARLPYTDAVLHESMRLGPVTPYGVPHRAMCDSTIGGYDIPKDSIIAVNVYGLHHHPDYWKDPEKFDPDRFLTEDGTMAPKPTGYLPFSAGRRVCLGEAVAKPEIFLIFACVLQRFRISFPDGNKPSFIPRYSALNYRPPLYEIIYEERK